MTLDWRAGCRMALLLCASALATVCANAQEYWSREQYTSENGLLQNRVHAIDQDPWGGLLIGTEGGLVRFDGENFRQIGISAPEGMLPSRVLEIIPVAGSRYVVRDAGSRLFVYDGHGLAPITGDAPARKPISRFGGTAPSVDVAVMALDPDSILDGKQDWQYGVRLVQLGGDQWCVRTMDQLLVYKGRDLAMRITVPMGKWSHVFTLKGVLYVLDKAGVPYRVDLRTGQSTRVATTGMPAVEVHDGQLNWRLSWDMKDSRVTLITGEGLFTLEPAANGSLEARHIPLQLPTDCRVGGLVWMNGGQAVAIGTDTKGLFVYRRNTMRSLTCDMATDGVNNAYFAQAPYGRNGVLTSTRGTARLFDEHGCAETRPLIRGFDESAILLDREQRYWYGRGDSLFNFDMATNEERLVEAGLRPLCFLEKNNELYIGAPKGIYTVSQGRVELTNPLNESNLSQRPTALCVIPGGALWVATCSGVYQARPEGGWEPVPGLGSVCARALAEVDGTVFIGTYGSGAFMYNKGQLLQLPTDQEGFLSHVHAFMPDGNGFLWMSTNQGLFRLRLSDLYQWAKDPHQSVYMAYYGKRSGIANSEFNGGCSPSYVRTGDGWASFPTMDGLVWFRPESVPDAYPLEPVILENLVVDGVPVPVTESNRLAWDHREVTVSFSIAYWGTRENVKLEYSLEGVQDGKWIAIRPGQREIHFANLASGQSTLRIRKVGASLRGDGNALELRFIVPAPYYRTSWFITLCVLAGGLIFWSALRLNAARLRRKNLQLEKMVRARTGELMSSNAELRKSLEMKEMLVSIISHDIVTPLRFIARVSNGAAHGLQSQDPQRLEDTLHDLARSSEKLHSNAQGLLQWIKRQDGRIDLRLRNVAMHPLVEEVLAMERERALDKGIQLVNAVPLDDVVPSDRNVLSIILHNLIANAVTHTNSGHVQVRAAAEGKTYQLSVQDTGSGMPEAALKHAMRIQGRGALGAMNVEGERDVQGLGLLIVADLLQLLGATFTVQSAKGQGTTITISLPLHPRPGKVASTPINSGNTEHAG